MKAWNLSSVSTNLPSSTQQPSPSASAASSTHPSDSNQYHRQQSSTFMRSPPTSPSSSLTNSPRSTFGACLDGSDQPVRVILVVYDLLPAGKLSSLAWLLGVGLYHTAVKIPAIGKEIAFGGHPHPQLSGIFSLPIPEDGVPSLPGLRWLCDIDMGHVKAVHHSIHHSRSQGSLSSLNNYQDDDESKSLIRAPSSVAKQNKPIRQSIPSRRHRHHSYPPPATSPPIPITPIDPQAHLYSSSLISSDSIPSSSASSSSSLPSQLETLLAILDQLRRSPDWNGTSYDLLRRNCNTFSDELCFLLTGKNAPKWINRAASVGTAFPCLVPTEWIEPPVAPPEDSECFEEDYPSPSYKAPSAMEITPTARTR